MTLCLLLLFSMLVTLSAGSLYYVSRTASEAYLYQQGLSSVYAAERGANVALVRLKAGVMGRQSFTLSLNGRRVKVTVTDTSASRTEGTVTSTASDAEGGYKRTVRIMYTSEEHEGQRIITVTNVLLVCQTYVTPCLMKSWSVSFGDFHPSGRIGKQL